MSAKRRLFEGILVLTALYEAETWNTSTTERRRLNIIGIKTGNLKAARISKG